VVVVVVVVVGVFGVVGVGVGRTTWFIFMVFD